MTTNSSGSSGGVGNTKQPSPSFWWCFTSFDITDIWVDQFRCSDVLDKYVMQYEVCPETGREHLQGVCRFKTKKRLSAIKKIFPKCHWEKCKNIKKSIAYCSKEDTRKEGTTPMSLGYDFPEPLELIEQLRPWQQDLLNLLQERPDNRTVHWYWEDVGNTGKTSFAKYVCAKYDAMYVIGKAGDMKYGVAAFHEKNNRYPKIIFLDYPRSSIGFNYKAIEEIKNGIFFSTKYESGMHIFNSPHIVIFSNEEPDTVYLSEDRWHIVRIPSSDEPQASSSRSDYAASIRSCSDEDAT